MGMLFLAVRLVRQQPVGRRCSFDSRLRQTAPCTEYRHNKCPITVSSVLLVMLKVTETYIHYRYVLKKGKKEVTDYDPL